MLKGVVFGLCLLFECPSPTDHATITSSIHAAHGVFFCGHVYRTLLAQPLVNKDIFLNSFFLIGSSKRLF